jgi:geranylgeranyl diphosphate synthase type I
MQTIPSGIFNPIYKQKISIFLEDFFSEKQEKLSLINTWGRDVSEKLVPFITQGKLLRGSLVLFVYETYAGEISEDALRVAAAIELLHSSLLIHDDIMDNDSIRRGQSTVFAQYQMLAEEKKFPNAVHFGQSMGICSGDIGFFFAFQLLSTITNTLIQQSLLHLCTQEMITVGLAQMQDVYFGYTKDLVAEKDIEKVYVTKTGRYTFSLPMMMGGLLAQQNETTIQKLEKLGENLGLIFQLKDDELSLFGNEEVTGKPEGSDIRENKKTVYRLYLFDKASADEKEKLEDIFGKSAITTDELLYVRQLIKTLDIQKMIDKKIQQLKIQAQSSITTLALPETATEYLLQLVTYISERKK